MQYIEVDTYLVSLDQEYAFEGIFCTGFGKVITNWIQVLCIDVNCVVQIRGWER